jgi:hypothetical protein
VSPVEGLKEPSKLKTPPLVEVAKAFEETLGVSGETVVEVVDAACSELGIERSAPLIECAEQCWVVLYGVKASK